jgi:2-succinyl-6-hydroxy-2,4-cyclohexadiene-1-carboxylate synthase
MPPTVVLLHGFTHTGASWGEVVAALGERYRPLAPDIRGHGAESARRPVDLAHVIEDISELAPASFSLAGYSMGGRVALHLARALPDRVRRLLLIGAGPGIADPAERTARRSQDERVAVELERSSIEEFAVRWADTSVLQGQSPEVRAAAHADRLRSTPDGLAAALRGLGTGALPPLWGELRRLRMPVTLIVGERDRKFRGIAERMAAEIPRAELEVVPGSGHAVHLESPSAVAAALGREGSG